MRCAEAGQGGPCRSTGEETRRCVTREEGSTVYHSLTSPHVAELLRGARTILSGVLAGQADLLAGPRVARTERKPPS